MVFFERYVSKLSYRLPKRIVRGVHGPEASACFNDLLVGDRELDRRRRRYYVPRHHRQLLKFYPSLTIDLEHGIGNGLQIRVGNTFSLVTQFLNTFQYVAELLVSRVEAKLLEGELY